MVKSTAELDVFICNHWEHGIISLLSMKVYLDCGLKFDYCDLDLKTVKFKM